MEGCVVRDFCFHFLVLSLVLKAYRCLPSTMDLSLVPSGSSKATVRDEAVLTRYVTAKIRVLLRQAATESKGRYKSRSKKR